MFFDPAMAFKMTIRRRGARARPAKRDTFGAQQHAPLLDVTISSGSNL